MIHGNSKFPWILRCGICMDIVGSTIYENPNMVILWFSEVDLQMFFKSHTKSTMGFWNFQLHRGNRKNQVKNVNLFVWSLAMAIQNTTVTMEMGITKLFQLGFLNAINGIVPNSFNGKPNLHSYHGNGNFQTISTWIFQFHQWKLFQVLIMENRLCDRKNRFWDFQKPVMRSAKTGFVIEKKQFWDFQKPVLRSTRNRFCDGITPVMSSEKPV